MIKPPSPMPPRFLDGKKLKQPATPSPPTRVPLIARADRLRGILYDRDTVGLGKGHDRRQVGGQAEQMHRDDGPG